MLVRLGPDSLDVHPGLLLFWWGVPAVDGAQWLAWVVWASGGGHHEVEAHQGWLRDDQLRPVPELVTRGADGAVRLDGPPGGRSGAPSPPSARPR